MRSSRRLWRSSARFRGLLGGDVLHAGQRPLEPRALETDRKGDLDLAAAERPEARLAGEAAMTVPKRYQQVDEDRCRLRQEDMGERLQQVLLPLDLEQVEGEGVDIDDPHAPDCLFDMFRVGGQMGAKIDHAFGAQAVEERGDGGEVLVPERDGSRIEDFAVPIFACHRFCAGCFSDHEFQLISG
jgi:hypothetical protein